MQLNPCYQPSSLKMEWNKKGVVLLFNIILIHASIVLKVQNSYINDDFQGDSSLKTVVSFPVQKKLFGYELTVCVRLLQESPFRSQYVFSNAIPQNKDFSISTHFQKGYGFFHVNGQYLIFQIPSNVRPQKWYHICFTKNQSTYSVIGNGELWFNSTIIKTISDDITFQDIMVIDEKFKWIDGSRSELNIWSTEMTILELKEMTESCGSYLVKPDIFSWMDLNIEDITYDDEVIEISEKDFANCNTGNKEIQVIPKLMTKPESRLFCETLQSELYIPTSKQEFESIIEDSEPSVPGTCEFYMVPLYLNEANDWVDLQGQEKPLQLKWNAKEPNGGGLQKCAQMRTNYELADGFCNARDICPICKWDNEPVFILKGLCQGTTLEHKYTLLTDKYYDRMMIFQGFNRNFIAWNESKNKWTLYQSNPGSKADNNIIGSMSSTNLLPVGLHQWSLSDTTGCNGLTQVKFTMVRK